jgi:hypothetical protein
MTTFLTALITSSAANALENDARRMDSPSGTEIAPAESDVGVKRRFVE